MLNTLKNLFSFDQAGGGDAPSEHDVHLAAAALLLEVGYADFRVSAKEEETVVNSLKQRFDLSDREAQHLLEVAADAHQEHSSLHPFVRRINEQFTAEQKYRIVEDMWAVAWADRQLDKYEEQRIRKIAELLYVPHRDFIRAKLVVQNRVR